MSRNTAFLPVLTAALLVAGCGFWVERKDPSQPPLDGEYDLQAVRAENAGKYMYDGQVSLQRNEGSFSGQGQLVITFDEEVQDTIGRRNIVDVKGTYNHPNVAMTWEVEDPDEDNPTGNQNVWSIDATVSAEADTIRGILGVGGEGSASITLTQQ